MRLRRQWREGVPLGTKRLFAAARGKRWDKRLEFLRAQGGFKKLAGDAGFDARHERGPGAASAMSVFRLGSPPSWGAMSAGGEPARTCVHGRRAI